MPLAVMARVSASKLYGVDIFPHFASDCKQKAFIIVATIQSSFRLAHYRITQLHLNLETQQLIILMIVTIRRVDLRFQLN